MFYRIFFNLLFIENRTTLVFQVTVKDDGKPSLTSTTRVIVNVEDVNDYGPEFEQKFYTVQIPASAELDKPLLQVRIVESIMASFVLSSCVCVCFELLMERE